MVDATASFAGQSARGCRAHRRVRRRRIAAGLSVSVADGSALAAYAEFCRSALFCAGAERRSGSPNWVADAEPDVVVATLGDGRPAGFVAGAGGRPQRTVPRCALHGRAPCQRQFRRCRRRAGWPRRTVGHFARFSRRSRRARPDIDLIALERLLPDLDGTRQSAAIAAASAEPESVARRRSRRRLRRAALPRQRQAQAQEAPLADAQVRGRRQPSAASRPGHRTEANALLDAFFDMKEARFRKMGIANVFGDSQVQHLLPLDLRRSACGGQTALRAAWARGRRQDSRRHRLEPIAAIA